MDMKRTRSNNPKLSSQTTRVDYQTLSFLIFDAPSESNLAVYIKEFQQHNIKDIVRACEPTYNKQTLSEIGIDVHVKTFYQGPLIS
jgi:protein tyrosine phosphatase type 4A